MADIIQYNNDFENIIAIIERSKARAIRAVNAEMIEMYWQIGKYISEKAANNGWGKSVVQDFALFLKQEIHIWRSCFLCKLQIIIVVSKVATIDIEAFKCHQQSGNTYN